MSGQRMEISIAWEKVVMESRKLSVLKINLLVKIINNY